MVDAAGAEENDRCSEKDSGSHDGRGCRSEADEHDARSQCDRSHGSVQPATQPGLDYTEHFGQLGGCAALAARLRRQVIAHLNCGHGFPFRLGRTPYTGEVTEQ